MLRFEIEPVAVNELELLPVTDKPFVEPRPSVPPLGWFVAWSVIVSVTSNVLASTSDTLQAPLPKGSVSVLTSVCGPGNVLTGGSLSGLIVTLTLSEPGPVSSVAVMLIVSEAVELVSGV